MAAYDDDALDFLDEDETELDIDDTDDEIESEVDELEEYDRSVKKRVNKKSDDDDYDGQPLVKKLIAENQELRKLAAKNAQVASRSNKEILENKISTLRATFKEAYESGDGDAVLEASQELADARFELRAIEYNEQINKEEKPAPVTDPKADAWFKENKDWFGKDAKMTALAYGIHEELVTKGVDPTSDEYYRQLNKEMRSVFPDKFGKGTRTPSKATPVVTPIQRSSGSNPRKVRLTPSQIRLAKRLNLTPQEYAKQALKDGVFSD